MQVTGVQYSDSQFLKVTLHLLDRKFFERQDSVSFVFAVPCRT